MPTLKEHRRRAVLSTRELAERADVSPATIWRIERGEVAGIRPATMRAISRVLDVRPADIAEFAGALSDKTSELLALAMQQGVRPIEDPGKLLGDFWPEQEDVDDFVTLVYNWRSEGDSSRNLS